MLLSRKSITLIFLIVTLTISAWWTIQERLFPQSCTIFTAVHENTVLFGNNEDWHSSDLVIAFFPPSDEGFGSVHLGFRHADGSIELGGAVNDHGLAWDVNSLPSSPLNPHPDRPYSHSTDNYLDAITNQASTVEEAIELARSFDFGETLAIQIHIADASGAAVVISAGPDGELAFTELDPQQGYLVSTNFNLANPENGTHGWRYDAASTMLDELVSSTLSPESAAQVLEAVHLQNLTSYTLYSNVIDLNQGKIHIYLLSQYDQGVTLDIDEELRYGQRIVDLSQYFPSEIVEAGHAAYQRFELRFRIAQISVIGLVGMAMVFVINKAVKKLRVSS